MYRASANLDSRWRTPVQRTNEGAKHLGKKILIAVALLVVVVLAVWGIVSLFSKPTAQATVETFMTDLSKSDSKDSYGFLSSNMKQTYTSAQWQTYVGSLGKSSGTPTFVRSSEVVDRFNVYAAHSNPQRFVYNLRINNRTYQLTSVILKQDGSWKVDDLQGGYK